MSKQPQSSSGSKKPVKIKKKSSQQATVGIAYVHASFNNTIITITDQAGRVITWSSAGKMNFSGSRKSSAFAATVAGQDAAKTAISQGIRELEEVILIGPGAGRESAVRGLQALPIGAISDKTPVPHNGCRSRKRRRV